MENRKERNNTWLIVFLVLIIIGLASYICYDELIAKDKGVAPANNCDISVDKTPVESPTDNKLGDCGLTKFTSSYKLTEKDKTEIMEALRATSTYDLTNYKLDDISVAKNGYYLNVSVSSDEAAPGFAYVAKVGGKFKVFDCGSGDVEDEFNRMNATIEWLCE